MEFNSLNKKSEFIELKKFGKRINHRFVSITYVEKQKEDFKLGFQISKKSGNPVFRNKIKRQIRNLIKDVCCKYKQNPSKNGLWISVYVNPAIEKFNYSEYKSFLEKKFDL